MLVLVTAPDPATRAAAAAQTIAGVRAIAPSLTERERGAGWGPHGLRLWGGAEPRGIERVETDEDEVRAFIRAHRHLFIPTAELEAAHDALAKQLAAAKLRANPLFVDLDDAPPQPARRARRAAREAARRRGQARAPGARQRRRPHAGDRDPHHVPRDRRRPRPRADGRSSTRSPAASAPRIPAVTLGFAGGPAVTIAEHGALGRGIVLSTADHLRARRARAVRAPAQRARCCAARRSTSSSRPSSRSASRRSPSATSTPRPRSSARSSRATASTTASCWSRATSRSAVTPAPEAMAAAIAGTLLPTLVASLGAAIAYGALAATQFRGFADFALIGGVGMLVCWIALVRAAARARSCSSRTHRAARRRGCSAALVVRVFGFRRPVLACALAGAVTLARAAVSWRYLAGRSVRVRHDAAALAGARRRSRRAAGCELSDEHVRPRPRRARGPDLRRGRPRRAGAGGRRRARAASAREPIVGPVRRSSTSCRADQPRSSRCSPSIRAQIDEVGRRARRATRAPSCSRCARPTTSPRSRRATCRPRSPRKLTERDGRDRPLISRSSPGADVRRARRPRPDRVRRRGAPLELPNGETVTTAGASRAVRRRARRRSRRTARSSPRSPRSALVAMVLLVVGRTRRAVAVLVATARRQHRDDRGVRARRPQDQLPRLRRAADHARPRHRLRDQHRGPRGRTPTRSSRCARRAAPCSCAR